MIRWLVRLFGRERGGWEYVAHVVGEPKSPRWARPKSARNVNSPWYVPEPPPIRVKYRFVRR